MTGEIPPDCPRPFEGKMRTIDGAFHVGMIGGEYHWEHPYRANARIVGHINVTASLRSQGFADPFSSFGVDELRGRRVRIIIPGVGMFPASLRGTAPPRPDRPVMVRFWGKRPPIQQYTLNELSLLLRIAIPDVLRDSGHDDLANAAQAAAVALIGFPRDHDVEYPEGETPGVVS